MIGSKNLTGETDVQAFTFPGQAHFAIPGATKHCADCAFWSPKYQGDKRAICRKAAMLTWCTKTVQVPGYARVCKHFEERCSTPD
jgi:hypothetical protein